MFFNLKPFLLPTGGGWGGVQRQLCKVECGLWTLPFFGHKIVESLNVDVEKVAVFICQHYIAVMPQIVECMKQRAVQNANVLLWKLL